MAKSENKIHGISNTNFQRNIPKQINAKQLLQPNMSQIQKYRKQIWQLIWF